MELDEGFKNYLERSGFSVEDFRALKPDNRADLRISYDSTVKALSGEDIISLFLISFS